MNKLMVAAPLALVACAAVAREEDAYSGIGADAVSTALALSASGAVDANPLGWATVPIRLAIVEHAKSLPPDEALPMFDATKATGFGAAANNLTVLAGASGFAPVVGVLVAWAIWKHGEREREFWRICGSYRKAVPETRCRYTAWRSEEVLELAGMLEPN